MTTTVTIEAHCANDTEVQVTVLDGDNVEELTLQDGETASRVVHGDREIYVKETRKASVPEAA